MKHSRKKSFDWYSMQQRYSIRKYHFGAASVLLGTALVLGTAANAQAVQAEEQHPEATNSVSVDKVDEATKPAEVSTPKKETTYAAPTVANPVEVTPAKSEDVKAPAEKVEEAKIQKEEVSSKNAVDKSKLSAALSRAEKLELKLYTEDSVKHLQSSIQSAQELLKKSDVTESDLSKAESDLQAAVIALELRGATTSKVADKVEVVGKIESAEKKNAESKVAEKTSEVDKESVEKDKTALKPVKGLRVEDAKANKKGGWNIPLDQEARLRLKSAIEAHAAQGSSRRRKRAIGDLDYTFKKVMTPVNPGFYADAKSVDELTVNPDYINETVVNVWYKDLGYINLVDKDGHYINSNGEVVENKEDAIRRQYKNDFNDTTRADVTEIPQAPVGWKISDNQSIHGYNAETKTIDPNDDNDLDAVGKDSNVVIEKENQKAVIRYVSTNGNRVLTTDEVTGKSGEAIAYSTTSQINEFKKQGYNLVSDEFTAGGAKVYDYDTARDQVYTVTLSERVEPVNPDNPTPQPNTPVNPGQPDSPRWPGTVENLDNKESVSRTIHYVYEDGSKAKDDVVETLNFKRWSRINLVTGQIFFQDWTTNDDTFDKVVSPTIAGYTADKSEIPAVSGVQAKDQDRVETVTYRKDAQKAVIRYVSTNGNRVLTTDEVTGKSGEAIAYSTTSQITEFKKQGYNLVSDEFTAGGAKVYDYDTARDQVYTVTLSERVEPVNPDNPTPQPNTPVNPGQPDSPRWPGTVENLDNKESVSRTIHYVYEDGSKAKDDVVETLNFKRWSNVNLVTGHIDFQDWTTNDDTFDKVVSPTIAGYTADKSEIPAVSGVKAKDQDRVETVTYRKDAQKAIIRYVSTNGNRVLTTDEVTGKSGEAIAYSTTSQITEFKKQGYNLVSDEFTAGGAKVYDYDTARDQVYTVTLSERVEPVNPDNPTPQPNTPVNPGQPDSPRWPASVHDLDNKESVSRTIHYVYEDGSKAKDDVVETLNFKRWSRINLVTGQIFFQDWTTNDDTFDKVVSPNIAGYTADKSEIPAVSGVKAKDQDRVETVTYRKDAQKAIIRYVSTNGNRVLTTDEVTGKSGEAIAYSTTSQITEFKKQGYNLVSDEFTAGGAKVYDYDTARDQVYTVTLSERVERVTPKDPKPQPNTPVNPGQPNTPNWPRTVERMEKLTQTISRRINFRYLKNGKAAYGTIDQHISYERNALVNLVSGDINYEQWKITGIKNQDVVAPVATQPSATTPTVANNSVTRVVRSSSVRLALAPQVTNSQESPLGLTVTENGERSVRRSSRGKRATVAEPDSSTNSEADSSVNAVFKAVRTPITPKFYATVNKVGTMEVNPNSPQDTEVNVDLKEMGRIVAVNNKGQYINEQGEVVQNIEDALYKYYDNDPNDATKAAETKIPAAPKFHVLNNTQPTVWGYNIVDKTIEPNDESDPDRIGKDTFVTYNEIIDPVSKETNQTVSFAGAGSATPKDNVQNDFVFKGSYNEATKETTWENKNHTYGTVKVPVVTGYFADKSEAGAKTVTPDSPKATDTVTYKALGKIIPVDASGNVIADAPQPQYLNDANDPRKAGETAVPEIVGYKPERTSVTPENPGEDTKVIYVKTDQVAVVRYIDVDNKHEVVHTDNVTGKSGEKIAYTTETVLKSLIEKGYLLQKDGFPTDATFDADETKVQDYTVLLKHKITVKKDVPKVVERTIHYVFADGTKASEDHHDQVSFSRMLSIDNVTGKTTSTSWVSEDGVTSFDEVVSPTIAGYNPDLAKVDSVQGITAETGNQVVTVTYRNVQPIPQVTPTPVPTPAPAPKVPSAVPTPTPAPKEGEKDLPKTAGHSSGMAQALGVLGLIAGFSLVGKAKRDE
ncbi:hypothetical protein SK1126_0687 [Streptococcus mitis]|uniref:Uncharacterized protein n=4 Tax=Streptococcus mitis TaxID=28037 RepID=A0A081PQ11_STRMT|nr:YSIRK-type signal peptide-containing protein [Streptococcus mitis]KEQ32784.1 hypothetical protein SK1126_0687 [Streptococcus mitis]